MNTKLIPCPIKGCSVEYKKTKLFTCVPILKKLESNVNFSALLQMLALLENLYFYCVELVKKSLLGS